MELHPHVIAVCQSPKHRFSKAPAFDIRVVAGLGVDGDAHFGATTQHRFEKRYAPDRPNLRQVHLIDVSLFSELRLLGFDVYPGELGENISTSGVDLTALPTGTILRVGDHAELQLTGLREPCVLLDRFRPGLRRAVGSSRTTGDLFLRGGVMSRVLQTGTIRPGDRLKVEYPPGPYEPLSNV